MICSTITSLYYIHIYVFQNNTIIESTANVITSLRFNVKNTKYIVNKKINSN